MSLSFIFDDLIPGTKQVEHLPLATTDRQDHFDTICQGLYQRGWAVVPDFLHQDQWQPLLLRASAIDHYQVAGVGRGQDLLHDESVRISLIHWLNDSHAIDRSWLTAMETLRSTLNRSLFLGLFEFEAHYACYPPGAFYKRHLDAFKGAGNRVVSTVLYLNPAWSKEDGGNLAIYPEVGASTLAKTVSDAIEVQPKAGTLVVFLSEDMPHEVLQTLRTRYSIAGWFRINPSVFGTLDPPR